MGALLEHIEAVGAGLLDPWVVVDAERRVVVFNRHFRALFDRAVARRLPGSLCCAHLALAPCGGGAACLARRALEEGAPVRLDEIEATLVDTEARRTLIVAANGLATAEEGPYALIVLRDVTDETNVQRKDRALTETNTGDQAAMALRLAARTLALKEANRALNAAREELLKLRRSLLG